MNISMEAALLIAVQITILALLGKRMRIQFNKGKIDISWERQN